MVLEEFWAFVSCSGWCRISILVKSWPFVICDSLEWLWAFVYGSGWSRLLVSERFWSAKMALEGFWAFLCWSCLVLEFVFGGTCAGLSC